MSGNINRLHKFLNSESRLFHLLVYRNWFQSASTYFSSLYINLAIFCTVLTGLVQFSGRPCSSLQSSRVEVAPFVLGFIVTISPRSPVWWCFRGIRRWSGLPSSPAEQPRHFSTKIINSQLHGTQSQILSLITPHTPTTHVSRHCAGALHDGQAFNIHTYSIE